MLSYKKLDFKPGSFEDLQRRFYKSLEKIYIGNDILNGITEPPSQNPDCVFDFEDGLRLIISKELFEDYTATHISASFQENSRLFNECLNRIRFENKENAQEYFLLIATSRYKMLSQDHREMKFLGFSEEKGVPHWIIKEDKP